MKNPEKILLVIGVILCLSPTFLLFAANKNSEAHYQKLAAKELKGEIEVVLRDKTRVDILTKEVAYEVDFARKWAEGIGQALHYSTMTERDAGLILIVESEKDDKYVLRVQNIMKMKSIRIILYVYDNRNNLLWRVDK